MAVELSASEQHQLDQIEEALAADDPQLAALLAGESPSPVRSVWHRLVAAMWADLANLRR